MSYYGISNFNFDNLEAFFAIQQPDGFIRRSFGPHPWGLSHHFKPFIAQITLLGSRQAGNFQLAKENYKHIQLYLNHWFEYDSDKNGLAYWSGGADHSGMDDQRSRCLGKSEGVDLNCYLVRELEAMAIIAEATGHTEDMARYSINAKELKALINELLRDEKAAAGKVPHVFPPIT